MGLIQLRFTFNLHMAWMGGWEPIRKDCLGQLKNLEKPWKMLFQNATI